MSDHRKHLKASLMSLVARNFPVKEYLVLLTDHCANLDNLIKHFVKRFSFRDDRIIMQVKLSSR